MRGEGREFGNLAWIGIRAEFFRLDAGAIGRRGRVSMFSWDIVTLADAASGGAVIIVCRCRRGRGW